MKETIEKNRKYSERKNLTGKKKHVYVISMNNVTNNMWTPHHGTHGL